MDIKERIIEEVDKLESDQDTVSLMLSRYDLRLIRDALITSDSILETSFQILNKYY